MWEYKLNRKVVVNQVNTHKVIMLEVDNSNFYNLNDYPIVYY